MANQTTQRSFTLGGSVLLTLACSFLVGWHVILILGLIGIIVAVGIGYVDYVQWWAGWWHTNEQEDKRVQYTAFGVAFVLAILMAVSGATVMALMYERFHSKEEAANVATVAGAKTDAQIKEEREFNRGLQQLQQSGASRSTISAYIKSYNERKKNDALNAPIETTAAKTDDAASVDTEKIMTYVRSYGRFGLFLLPILAAIFGQFAINFACMLPGGASVGTTSSGQSAPKLFGFRQKNAAPSEPMPASANADPKP